MLEVGEEIAIVGAVASLGARTVILPEVPADGIDSPRELDTTIPLIATGITPADALPEMLNCTSVSTPDPMGFVFNPKIRNRMTPEV